jgi:hypothetical protein
MILADLSGVKPAKETMRAATVGISYEIYLGARALPGRFLLQLH